MKQNTWKAIELDSRLDKSEPRERIKENRRPEFASSLVARFRVSFLWESSAMNLPWELPVATHPVIRSCESSNFARASFTLFPSLLFVVIVPNHTLYIYIYIYTHIPLYEYTLLRTLDETSGRASSLLTYSWERGYRGHPEYGVRLNDISV